MRTEKCLMRPVWKKDAAVSKCCIGREGTAEVDPDKTGDMSTGARSKEEGSAHDAFHDVLGLGWQRHFARDRLGSSSRHERKWAGR